MAVTRINHFKAAHKAALSSVPPETFQQVMPLLDGPPSGAYFVV